MWGRVGSQETAILSTKLTKKGQKWPRGLNLISNLNFLANFTLRTKLSDRSDNRKKIDFFFTKRTLSISNFPTGPERNLGKSSLLSLLHKTGHSKISYTSDWFNIL